MFQINDYVMHGGNGVCQVEEIGSIDLPGVNKDKMYYTLKPLFGRGNMIYTPTESEKTVIRELISAEEAKELIESMEDIDCIEVSNEKMRENEYKRMLKTYSCENWMILIKSIYKRKEEREVTGKKITSLDDKYLKIAVEYLAGELATVLEVEKEEIENKIQDKMQEIVFA